MQEQIEREAVAITLKATKLTAKTLAKVFMAVVRSINKAYQEAQTPHGMQSVKKLMNHNVPTGTIPVEGDKGLFEQIARKWHVDYAFHKTGPKQYLLLFKSGQSDAISVALSEYTARVMKRARDKRPPVMEEARKAAARAARENMKHKEHKREREAVRA